LNSINVNGTITGFTNAVPVDDTAEHCVTPDKDVDLITTLNVPGLLKLSVVMDNDPFDTAHFPCPKD
jgi:hypothetical protein